MQTKLSVLNASLLGIKAAIDSLGYNFGNGFWVDPNEQEFKENLSNIFHDEFPDANYNDYRIVHYDFNSDELDEQVKDRDKHSEIFNAFDKLYTDLLYSAIDSCGFDHIETVDGSGGGLFYGGILVKLK